MFQICDVLSVDWVPSAALEPFAWHWGQLGPLGQQQCSFCLPGPAQAFLAANYAVKSPVIKQLEGPFWGDLVHCGMCQSDRNQDLHRPSPWWHSATLPWANAQRLISVIHAFIWRSTRSVSWTQKPTWHMPWDFGSCQHLTWLLVYFTQQVTYSHTGSEVASQCAACSSKAVTTHTHAPTHQWYSMRSDLGRSILFKCTLAQGPWTSNQPLEDNSPGPPRPTYSSAWKGRLVKYCIRIFGTFLCVNCMCDAW